MPFFDEVKEFFGFGEAETAESGLAEAGERAAKGVLKEPQGRSDAAADVDSDVEVVRAKQDLQVAEQQLATATRVRHERKKELQSKLATAKQASYMHRQRYSARGEEAPDPNEAIIRDCESKLSIFAHTQYSVDVKNAQKSVERMKQKVMQATAAARSRARQQSR